MYYYKARMYSPTLGRFMQTDPIGYGDGLNWYRYAGNDPINGSDPSGMFEIVVTGYRGSDWRERAWDRYTDLLADHREANLGDEGDGPEIVVTAQKPPQNQQPDCNTVLPNGKTVGDVVRSAVDDTLTIGADVGSNTDYAASVTSKMELYTFPYGGLDFKNKFRGQADPAFLAAAGNFAYGAYVSALAGPSVSNFGAKLYGTVAGWLGLKSAKFLAPNGMSKSGAANVPRGNANAGCPR